MASKADLSSNFDAERVNEEVASGEAKVPEVDVESDYERSKEFDVSEVDKPKQDTKSADKKAKQ